MRKLTKRWTPWLAAAGLAWALFAGTYSGQANQPGQPPFRNPVEQREQMIRELQEIKALMQQQNALLRTVLEKQ
jgi:hypothetical protein